MFLVQNAKVSSLKLAKGKTIFLREENWTVAKVGGSKRLFSKSKYSNKLTSKLVSNFHDIEEKKEFGSCSSINLGTKA